MPGFRVQVYGIMICAPSLGVRYGRPLINKPLVLRALRLGSLLYSLIKGKGLINHDRVMQGL